MWHSYGAPIPGRTSGTILGWWCGRSYRCPYNPSAPHHPALHLPGNDWPQLPKHPLAKTKTVIKFIFSFKKKTNNSFFKKAWLLLHDREKWHKIRTPKSLGNFWGFLFYFEIVDPREFKWLRSSLGLTHDLFSSYLEPINGTAIDEGWKFTQSVTEGISNRTHGQHNMELITNSLDKEVK